MIYCASWYIVHHPGLHKAGGQSTCSSSFIPDPSFPIGGREQDCALHVSHIACQHALLMLDLDRKGLVGVHLQTGMGVHDHNMRTILYGSLTDTETENYQLTACEPDKHTLVSCCGWCG